MSASCVATSGLSCGPSDVWHDAERDVGVPAATTTASRWPLSRSSACNGGGVWKRGAVRSAGRGPRSARLTGDLALECRLPGPVVLPALAGPADDGRELLRAPARPVSTETLPRPVGERSRAGARWRPRRPRSRRGYSTPNVRHPSRRWCRARRGDPRRLDLELRLNPWVRPHRVTDDFRRESVSSVAGRLLTQPFSVPRSP